MHFVGFLKRHEPMICATEAYPITMGGGRFTMAERNAVIDFLDQGTAIIPFLHWVHDTDGQPLSPHIIYSDGQWIWPSYYKVYLQKYPQISVPAAFVKHVKNGIDVNTELKGLDRHYVEYLLAIQMKIHLPSNHKIPVDLQELITKKGLDVICH